MTVQTVSVTPTIVWDDNFVYVISFTGAAGSSVNVGFIHMQVQPTQTQGTQTQVSQTLQVLSSVQVQFTPDPECWVETIKNSARTASDSTPKTITIVYDDSTSVNYTTQTGTIFTLQQLFSLFG